MHAYVYNIHIHTYIHTYIHVQFALLSDEFLRLVLDHEIGLIPIIRVLSEGTYPKHAYAHAHTCMHVYAHVYIQIVVYSVFSHTSNI